MILFIIIAGLFKAFQDNEVRKGNNLKSWKRKWALDADLDPVLYNGKAWWYLGIYKPQFIEKFAFSSTLLVSITDKWHLYGSLRDFSLLAAISLYLNNDIGKIILITIGLKIIMSITFQIIFTLLKNKRMKKLSKRKRTFILTTVLAIVLGVILNFFKNDALVAWFGVSGVVIAGFIVHWYIKNR